jgi:hypothetical protein
MKVRTSNQDTQKKISRFETRQTKKSDQIDKNKKWKTVGWLKFNPKSNCWNEW